jgi:hypothetical protein
VIGKAEVMAAGDNPRFVVTNLPAGGLQGEEDRERFMPQRLVTVQEVRLFGGIGLRGRMDFS